MTFQQEVVTTGAAETYDAAGNDDRHGVVAVPFETDENDSPSLRVRLARLQEQIGSALLQLNGGAVSKQGVTGLTVDVKGLSYRIAGTEFTLADTSAFACTDDTTTFLYVDTDAVVEQASAWPGTAHFKLAKVVTASGNITSVTPALRLNHNPGTTDVWSPQAATTDVNFADFDIKDPAFLHFKASTELTISSGSITPTQSIHSVDTESDDATDLLLTAAITNAQFGSLLILRSESASRIITISHVGVSDGDFQLEGGVSFTFNALPDWIAFVCRSVGGQKVWSEIFRSNTDPAVPLSNAIDFDGEDAIDVGLLRFDQLAPEITISSGAAAAVQTLHTVDTESDAASDDLVTITGGTTGDLLIISASNTARTVVVKHGTSTDQFALNNAIDYSMTTSEHHIGFKFDGIKWVEIFRSHYDGSELAGGAKAFPVPIFMGIAGGLSVAVDTQHFIVPYDMVIESITGYVNTQPTDATLIVDLLVDGLSMFSAQAEMINITTASSSDTSSVKDAAVSAGARLTLEVEQVGSTIAGSDLVVAIKGYAAAQTPR